MSKKVETDTRIKDALTELGLSIIHGLKIVIVYMIPALVVALLASTELRDLIANSPRLATYAPLINFAFIVVADLIKKKLPDSNISKVL